MKPPIPPDLFPLGFDDDPIGPPTPPPDGLRRWGIGLFLVSLTVLFAATLVAYITIRYVGIGAPPPGTVRMPRGLWWSTAALLACGGVVTAAQAMARRAAVAHVRSLVVLAWSLSVAFLILQAPSMSQLVGAHSANTSRNVRGVDGLVFTLIALHALHVVGGLIPLTRLCGLSLTGRFTHAHLALVRSCAAYWHFLELVWLAMFATFLIVK